MAAGVLSSGDLSGGFGNTCGYNFATAADNIFMGYRAGFNQRSGSSNVVIGKDALYTSRGAGGNVAIGGSAVYYNTTGYQFKTIARTDGMNKMYIT